MGGAFRPLTLNRLLTHKEFLEAKASNWFFEEDLRKLLDVTSE